MKKVKTFFHILQKSFIPSIEYYKKIVFTKFTFSLKYFLTLTIFVNLISVSILMLKFNPFSIQNFLVKLNESLIHTPPDFNVKIIDGTVISSYPYPFFLWLDNPKKLFLVVDEFSDANKINQYETIFLINKNSLLINLKLFNKNIDNLIIPTKNIENLVINKEKLYEFSKIITWVMKFVLVFYFALILLIFIALTISTILVNFFSILFASIFVFFVFRYLYFPIKKKIHFKKIFQIGFHAITFPLIINFLSINFIPEIKLNLIQKLPIYTFPLIFVLIVFIFNFTCTYFAFLENHKPPLPSKKKTFL